MSPEIALALVVLLALVCLTGATIVVEQRRLQRQLEELRREIEKLDEERR